MDMTDLKILRKLFFVLILGMLFGCASPPKPHHTILGTTYGWDAEGVQVLLDAQVGQLRIRHVRMANAICVSGHSDHMEIQGEIGPDSTAAVERLIPRLHKCTKSDGNWIVNTVYLNSGGGMMYDGYRMGNLFREHEIQTQITGGQQCASSCAIAFLGGKFRAMAYDAKLLFHAPYTTEGIAINCMDRGQVGRLKDYYIKMLGSRDGEYLFERTMSYCSSSSGWTLNADGAKLFNITTP